MEGYDTLLDLLEATARRYAGQLAVRDGDRAYTWQQLAEGARGFAGSRLLAATRPGGRVGVMAHRRGETPLLMLAVLYSGCCYVPLDPDLPPQRLRTICADAGLEAVCGAGPCPPALAGVRWLPYAGPEPDPGPETAALLARRRADLHSGSPLYLIYTSGSTGTPKGVLKTHGAMLHFLDAFLAEYPLLPGDVLGNQTPFAFDASAKDLYWCIAAGCRLEILPTRLFALPVPLVEYMNERGCTVISWVPSALTMVSQLGTFSTVRPQGLRMVLFVGEVFPVKQLERWRAALPDTVFVNLYGSSEIAGVCCHYRVEGELPAGDALPIGRPFAHCRLSVRDARGAPCASGTEGELWVESPSIALEYWNDPTRTQAAFVEYTGPDEAPHRCLRTGDMAVQGADGLFRFGGRRDFQIKHKGYRIELGDIEANIDAMEEVVQSACVYDRQRGRIVLFVQLAAEAQDLPPEELTRRVNARLCSYMQPWRVQVLPALPHGVNGKLDRQALLEMAGTLGRRRDKTVPK